MLITLPQLERNPVRFELEVEPEALEFDQKLALAAPLHAKGSANLVNRSLGEVRVTGTLSGLASCVCDRCLESTTLPISSKFDLLYVPNGDSAGGEHEVELAVSEVGFYDGSSLNLNEVLREVVLLALPMQVVCQESCKGICAICGQNRNAADCDCQVESADDRWSKLRDYRPRPA